MKGDAVVAAVGLQVVVDFTEYQNSVEQHYHEGKIDVAMCFDHMAGFTENIIKRRN